MKQEFKIISEFIEKNTRVLDVGCGGGLLCEPMSKLGANVTGIDIGATNNFLISVFGNKLILHVGF